MAKRFTSDFYDINGIQFTLDVYDTDFVGSATAFTTKHCTIQYGSSNNDDLSSPIIGSRAKIGMTVPVDDATLTAFVEDFASSVEDRFSVEILKTSGSVVVWRGILVPDFAGEEDTAPLYVFNISALCGLGLLKKKPYHDGAAIYTGIDRLTGHLTMVLSKLTHTDGFWGASDIFLKTAVDWWAVSMASGGTDDAMYQGGVDHAAFYNYGTQGGVDKDVLSCYDVLWHILKSFECRIYQTNGVWWVEQIGVRSASSFFTRHYSKSGGYLSNATNAGVNNIDQTHSGAKIATVNYDFLPALERAEVTYDVNLRRNFLAGTVQNSGNFDTLISSNSGAAIMTLRFTITYEVTNNTSPLGAATMYYIIPAVTLKVGSWYLTREYTITNFTAHVTDLSWETSGTIAVPILLEAVPLGTTKQGKITFDMICPALPDDGSDNYFGTPSGTAEMARQTGAPVDETDFDISIDISSRFLEIFDLGTPVVSEDQVLYISENPAAATEIYETNIRLGSAGMPNSAGRVMRWDGANWNLASYWGQGVDSRVDFLGDLLARNILNSRDTIRRRLNGSIYGDIDLKKLLRTSDGKDWLFGGVSWDIGKNTMQGTWFELNYGAAGVNSSPVKIKIQPAGGGFPTSDPSPTNGGITNSAPGFNANPPPTVLAPVAYNGLDGEIEVGDVITSIPLKIASLGNEFLAGDGVTLVNPVTGQFQTFEIASAPALGATSLSIVSEASDYVFPEDSYLVVKQNAYAFALPTGTNGDHLYFNGTEWVGQNFAEAAQDTIGSVLVDTQTINLTYTDATPEIKADAITQMSITSDASGLKLSGDSATPGNTKLYGTDGTGVKGWYAQPSGSGLSDGDYGDITVSGGGTVMNIDAGVVGTTEIADLNVTTGKLADSAVTTAKIADLNVTTGKLADDAVTFAKMQNIGTDKLLGRDNAGSGDIGEIGLGASLEFDSGGNIQRAGLTGDVTAVVNSNTLTIADNAVNNFKLADMAANTIKGNNTGGAADPKDLTVAQVQTLLGFLNATGAGLTSPRIPFANDANTLQDEVNLRWLTGTQEVIIGGDVSLDARFSHNSTANITGSSNLLVGDNNVSGDYIILLKNTRNASNTGRSVIISEVGGASAGDAFYVARIAAGQNWAWGLDNSDGDKFKITSSTAPGNVANSGLIITPAAVALVGINKDAPAHPLDVSGRAMATEFINTNNAPTVDTIGNGMGVGGAINVVAGGNNGFYISFTTGTTPVNNGDLFRVVYQTPYPASSFPVFCQGDINSANNLSKFYYSAIAGASFNMKANGTLPASTNFILFFNVFGR